MTEETPAQRKKRLEKRNRYRTTVCKGCRYNYSNYPKESDGWNAGVPKGYSCWHIDSIRRGKCPCHS